MDNTLVKNKNSTNDVNDDNLNTNNNLEPKILIEEKEKKESKCF